MILFYPEKVKYFVHILKEILWQQKIDLLVSFGFNLTNFNQIMYSGILNSGVAKEVTFFTKKGNYTPHRNYMFFYCIQCG